MIETVICQLILLFKSLWSA